MNTVAATGHDLREPHPSASFRSLAD
jgi:hypothetical protein